MAESILYLDVFEKCKDGNDGKKFSVYLTSLPGQSKKIRVKFRQGVPLPQFPCTIGLKKSECNLADNTYEKKLDSGETVKETVKELWVSGITESRPYEDHSMDEYFK